MILNDDTIERLCAYKDLISPYLRAQLQPASYDVSLLNLFNIEDEKEYQSRYIGPKQFMLGSTIEKICLPNNIVARIEGKSSWARKGLIVHTAGFIDPGFCGQLTLEITNLSERPVLLEHGMLIAQIAFQKMNKPAKRPYGHPELGSHYQGQQGATPSVLG